MPRSMNPEIGRSSSVPTVRTVNPITLITLFLRALNVSRILSKLNLRRRSEATAFVARHRLPGDQ